MNEWVTDPDIFPIADLIAGTTAIPIGHGLVQYTGASPALRERWLKVAYTPLIYRHTTDIPIPPAAVYTMKDILLVYAQSQYGSDVTDITNDITSIYRGIPIDAAMMVAIDRKLNESIIPIDIPLPVTERYMLMRTYASGMPVTDEKEGLMLTYFFAPYRGTTPVYVYTQPTLDLHGIIGYQLAARLEVGCKRWHHLPICPLATMEAPTSVMTSQRIGPELLPYTLKVLSLLGIRANVTDDVLSFSPMSSLEIPSIEKYINEAAKHLQLGLVPIIFLQQPHLADLPMLQYAAITTYVRVMGRRWVEKVRVLTDRRLALPLHPVALMKRYMALLSHELEDMNDRFTAHEISLTREDSDLVITTPIDQLHIILVRERYYLVKRSITFETGKVWIGVDISVIASRVNGWIK